MKDWSLEQRFVISAADIIKDLSVWEECFFFYPNGLKDAIQTTLATFEYPTPELDLCMAGYNPIMHDVEVYFDALERSNSLPANHADYMDMLEFAMGAVDKAVYDLLTQTFGPHRMMVRDARQISPDPDYVISVQIYR